MSLGAPATPPLDTTFAVETPEHVRFRYQVAGPGRRAGAFAIDLAARCGAIVFAGMFLMGFLGAVDLPEVGMGLLLLVWVAVDWGYGAFFEVLFQGQTPGKLVFGLRSVREDGSPMTVSDAVLRNLLRAADWFPSLYLAGVASMVLDSRFRRLGDVVAGTVVIAEDRTRLAPEPDAGSPPTPEERAAMPPWVHLSTDERNAIAAWLRSRRRLGHFRSQDIAEQVADGLGRRHGMRHRDPARLLELLYQAGTGHVGTGRR